jgi:hypothetical protein
MLSRSSEYRVFKKQLSFLTAPHRLGRPFSASSGNPLPNPSPVRHLSWGSGPSGISVRGANLPRGFQPAVRLTLSGFLTLPGFHVSPNRCGFVSHHNAFGISPFSAFSPLRVLFPFPGKYPSCRCFHTRFFSEEKEANMVARLQGFIPRAGPCVPVHRSELRRRGAPGVLPLSRFHPRTRMLQAT